MSTTLLAAPPARLNPKTVLELLKPITWFAPMWA
ncbi:MAG: bacteriochlorophyll/chlorophyll a synthase, partial [Gemmatimonadaceae bacterium]|nr:bacteriochlorophyll/chlorophyll a synthase [Acetobacteraceae bacterium]